MFSRQQYFGFDPRSVPGCQLWLDAADTQTVILSGNAVTQWNDKSINKYQFTQPATTNRPTYTLSGQNNRNVISFSSASSQYLGGPSNISVVGTNSISCFVVCKFATASSTGSIFAKSLAGDAFGRLLLLKTDASTMEAGIVGAGNRSFTDASGSTRIIGFITDRETTATATYFVNSSQTAIVSGINTTSNFNDSIYAMIVGAYNNTSGGINPPFSSFFFDGYICEILLYNSAISFNQRRSLETYLSQKWGITLPYAIPNFSRGFLPYDISGCTIWIDAADASTVTYNASNGQITQVRDKASGFIFSNSSGFTYNITTLNGNPTFYNATGLTTSSIGSNTSIVLSQPHSVFVVGTALSNGQFFDSTSSTSRWFSQLENTRTTITSGTFAGSNTIVGYQNDKFISYIEFNGANSRGFLNGVPYTTFATSLGTTQCSGLILGQNQSLTNAFQGHLCEYIFFDRKITSVERFQIEGYIAEKWNMCNRPTISSLVPSNISGCVLWLDAADSSTFTLSGNTITQWRDKSSNSYLTYSTAGRTPTYASNIRNGLNVVQYATGQTSIINNFALGQSMSIFLVNTPIDSDGGLFIEHSTDANSFNGFYFQSLTGHNMQITGPSTTTRLSAASNVGVPGTWTMLEGFNNDNPSGTSNLMSYYRNGMLLASTAANTGTTTYTSNLFLNGRNNTNLLSFNLYVGELLIYNRALTPSERFQVERYLANKWNLPLGFPLSHPYYNLTTVPTTSLFAPSTLSNLGLWLDGADPTSITGTTTVTAWNDKSGNARHATATSNHPSYTHGTNYIQFSGSNWMSFPGTFLSNTQYTLFYAVKRDVSQAEMFFMSSGTDTTTNANLHIGYTPNSATLSYRQWTNQFSFSVPAFTTQATEPNNIFCFQQNATQRLAFLNGTQVGSNANTSLVLSNNDALLGVYFRSPTTSWNGRFYEVVMYNRALTVNERQLVEGYLGWKFNNQNILPTTHPYYKFRP